MSNAVLKEQRIKIIARNKSIVARPRPALGKSCTHSDQVNKAYQACFDDHKDTLKLLSTM